MVRYTMLRNFILFICFTVFLSYFFQGVVRWCLMALVRSVQQHMLENVPYVNSLTLQPERKLSKQTSKIIFGSKEREKEKEKEKEKGKDHNTSDIKDNKDEDDNLYQPIKFNLCQAEDIINKKDTPDPYLTSVCSIIKRIIISEVQKKDLDLIANIIIYTFSTKGNDSNSMKKKESKKNELKKNEMKDKDEEKDKEREYFENTSANSNSSSGSSSGFGTQRRQNSTNNGDENESSINDRLSPLALLRVYLLRLLFSIYDENINKIILKVTTVSGKERERERERDKDQKVFY